MFKGNLKYYFLLFLFSSLFLVVLADISIKGNDTLTDAFLDDSQSQQLDNQHIEFLCSNFSSSSAFNIVPSQEATSNVKFVMRKRKQQNKLKLVDKHVPILLTADNSNTFLIENSQTKQIDKSNHEVFLI